MGAGARVRCLHAVQRGRNEGVMAERYELEGGVVAWKDLPKPCRTRRGDGKTNRTVQRFTNEGNGGHMKIIEPEISARRAPLRLTFPAARPREASVAIVLPYYNEARFIGATLRSLLTQSRRPDQIILVDNASTDGTTALCREILGAALDIEVRYLHDPRPGKVNALETGCAAVTCDFVALCDADVIYPPHHLERAVSLFAESGSGTVAVMAQIVSRSPADCAKTRGVLRRNVFWSQRLPGKCFTGGAGQVFRVDALRRAGGFSAGCWDCVLLDHEIMNRMRRQGRSLYHEDMWVLHSDRRSDRRGVRWGLADRLLYRYTPNFLGDWFFYRWLAPRLRRRGMTHLNLRLQPWNERPGVSSPPPSVAGPPR